MTAQKDGYVLKLVPRYAVFSLVFAFLWNSLIYNGAIALQRGRPALDMTTALEDAIPFQPGWIVVYFGCFLFWGVNYILISRRGKELWFRFLTADLLAELICGLFFVFLPTTNVRPEIIGSSLFHQLTAWLYQIDPAKICFHLFTAWPAGSASLVCGPTGASRCGIRRSTVRSHWQSAPLPYSSSSTAFPTCWPGWRWRKCAGFLPHAPNSIARSNKFSLCLPNGSDLYLWGDIATIGWIF